MAEKHHIIEIINTRSDLQTNLDSRQIAIETDNDENMVFKDDDGTYHILADQKSTGVSGDNTFGNITAGNIIADNITITTGGLLDFTGDINFSNTANHTINIDSVDSGYGKDLTIQAGDTSAEAIGGDLYLKGGFCTSGAGGVVEVQGGILIVNTNNGATINDTIRAHDSRGLTLINSGGYSELKILEGNNAGIQVDTSIKALTSSGIALKNSESVTQMTVLGGVETGISVNGIVRAASGSGLSINAVISQPLQPSFLVKPSGNLSNVTGGGTAYTVVFATEIRDIGSHFSSTTFTAPVTGVYHFDVNITVFSLVGATNTTFNVSLVTSNRTYKYELINLPALIVSITAPISIDADMDVNDTAYVTVTVAGGTKVVDVDGDSYFSGRLVG